ncbi:flagellar type III secretion system pore protein FliP [Sphingomonas changnyeongensis]|uniref:Flagellar biosynthetic protein FliP n=1 Tax=Sphingomonas changnyeongensis TaxID=2698679 RepID=A0A7Z2S806_9SPHN|nr:flagellar type III secretion system pore protein FliP [Sphingomonas changnyeongensis]QHL90177.1 flagellar type III secretion system pore protein FliP [Sphingomonas changnyeongensis]
MAEGARRRPAALFAALLLLGAPALTVAAPAVAQPVAPSAASAPAAPAPVAASARPGAPEALDRALADIGSSRGRADTGGEAPLSLSLQILIIMSLLTVLPSLLLMMTSFTRIIIVLSILRQALGLQQTPPNQVLIGLSLFLTLFVMSPVLSRVNAEAVEPYAAGRIQASELIRRSGDVMHGFMIKQTRVKDLQMFSTLAKKGPFARPTDIPFSIALPAFVTSELKTAFQIGFLIFLPFLIIDLVVASVLMALGMMMLSPTIISLPFKLLLFVLVDGWALTMGSLANSFVG